tara:strand:+ start:160 stop:417 length:258 start_codon:yes stop_codon:yes gene_type:complete
MKKVNSKTLKKIIMEEVAKMTGELKDAEKLAKETPETEASELASSLEQNIDFMKALNIQEARLVKKLKRIQEAKSKIGKRILKDI